MISLMKSVLGPSVSNKDKMFYATSLALNHSLSSEKDLKTRAMAFDTLDKLICQPESRYQGLHMLEITLLQNSQNNFNRKRWLVVIYEIIKDPKLCTLEKQLACKILALIIPYMKSDSSYEAAKEELTKGIFPFLLDKIHKNVEWAQEACVCVKICFQSFPNHVACYQRKVLEVVLNQASNCVSAELFEVVAECFAELPNCGDGYKDRWRELYLQTLKTMESLLVACLNNEPYSPVGINAKELPVEEEQKNNKDTFVSNFERRVRCFSNLCKCLSKLLSVKSRGPIKAPINSTLKILFQLFSVCKKDAAVAPQNEILCTFIAQMRLGGLLILESLILNCHLVKYTTFMSEIIRAAVETSYSSITSQLISEHRIAIWKILTLWLDGYGLLVSKTILDAEANLHIVKELLSDTSIVSTETTQENKTSSKKGLSSNANSISKRHDEAVCGAALDSLNSILVAGIRRMSKEIFKEICQQIFKICDSIDFSRELQYPYNKESCREKLYTVVLTIIENVKSDDYQTLYVAIKVIDSMNQDPNYKVKTLINKAYSKFRLQFYTNRQLPLVDNTGKSRQSNCNDSIDDTWASKSYVSNLSAPTMADTSDTMTLKTEPTSESEVEVHTEEYMEPNYTEHVLENHCNEEIEIQSSSQCQDDVDSDDEEEEEEEERSYADEEMNQEEPPQEMYIPVTREIPTPPPVQISTEIVQSTAEPEYEELTPCIKIEESTVKGSVKDKCVNGERNAVHDENLPSSSTQKTNENGIFGIDDDDLDEENDEEEDEENCDSPGEKRVEAFEQPPSKKQKVETKDDIEDGERNERQKSPTLDEMKADFLELLPSIEDVKSGKVQLSSP